MSHITGKAGGGVGPVGPEYNTVVLENKGLVLAKAGQVVAVDPSGVGFVLANATVPTRPAFGLCLTDIAPTFAGEILLMGAADVTDWTAAIGAPSLSPNSLYFLDGDNGKLTVTAPSSIGMLVQPIGRAVSQNKLDLLPTRPVLL
jgi:hypothetical protein